MEKEAIIKLNKRFEEYAYQQDGIEYWLARELQELLEYTQWRNFENVIAEAKIACEKSGNAISDHFANVSKKVQLGSGAIKEIPDFMLTRYACYLIAQNGDPKKDQIVILGFLYFRNFLTYSFLLFLFFLTLNLLTLSNICQVT